MKKHFTVVAAFMLLFGMVATSQAEYIVNGAFTSNLNSWTTTGDVDWENAALSPMTGGYAILGSDTNDWTNTLEQNFAIPNGIEQLDISFDYIFGGSDTSSSHYDTALAQIREYIGGTFHVSSDFIDLDSPTFQSGHYSAVVTLDETAINNATLRFRLTEDDSNNTNTYFAVDNVSANAHTSELPEPATMLLLGLGLLGVAGFRKIKK